MKTKNLLVSFCLIASVLFLMSTVTAGEIAQGTPIVYIDGVSVDPSSDVVSVIAGDTISIRVVFTASDLGDETAISDVRIEAQIDRDVKDVTDKFDVEEGKRYSKTLSLKVPYELDDDLSDESELKIEIYNKDLEDELTVTLRVQREPYNIRIMSISTSQTAEAGELLPVDVVLRNVGYNDLDDLYVTISIPELGIGKTSYFGDLVSDEWEYDNDDDETDTVSGRIYLEIPENAKAGTYTLKVEVSNEDIDTNKVKEIVIESAEEIVIKSSDGLIIVNPGNKVKVYRVVSDTSEKFVVVSAGSSETIEITEDGEYNIFSEDELIKTVTFEGKKSKVTTPSPVAILTVVLAIIFIVLLIVLFVLVGKKPEKSEEFGESYY